MQIKIEVDYKTKSRKRKNKNSHQNKCNFSANIDKTDTQYYRQICTTVRVCRDSQAGWLAGWLTGSQAGIPNKTIK